MVTCTTVGLFTSELYLDITNDRLLESGYRSPNPPPGRSPMGAGMSSSHDNMNNAPMDNSEEAADVDGDPIPQLSQSKSSPSRPSAAPPADG